MAFSRRKFLALSGAAASTTVVPARGLAWTLQAVPGNDAATASDGFRWPANRALPIFPEAQHLESADLSALSGDEQGLLVSMEGVVNRTRPRLYLYWGTDGTNAEWRETLETTYGVPGKIATDPWSIFNKHRSEVNGAIVYDPNVPDTINLATTLAGVYGAVIATGPLAKALNLPVLEDLRGRFADKFAVYDYALSKVWPSLTKRLMAAIGPSQTVAVQGIQFTTVLKVSQPVTDASNKGTYTADLTPFVTKNGSVYVRYGDAYTGDGWGPSVDQVTVVADNKVIASFVPGTAAEAPYLFENNGSQVASGGWRFADGTAYFTYKFTPPEGTQKLTLSTEMWNEYQVSATSSVPSVQMVNPLFRDYIVATSAPNFWLDPNVDEESKLLSEVLATFDPDSAYLGWFPNGDEMTGVTQCAQKGVYVVAADTFYNASAFSGVRAEVSSKQPALPTLPQIANKIYLGLILVEGDNIQFNQHRMRMMWDDPARGQVPLGWSISVLLRDIAPAMLSYYQRTATTNDLLVAGPSGAGYTYPSNWPQPALTDYLKQSGRYIEATGMNVLFAYNRQNSTDLPLTDALVSAYKKYAPNLEGIVLNYETTSAISMVSGVPVATLLGVNDIGSGAMQLQSIAQSWSGSAPLFVAVGLESWNMLPSDVVTLVKGLGPQFEILRPDAFFSLYQESLKSKG